MRSPRRGARRRRQCDRPSLRASFDVPFDVRKLSRGGCGRGEVCAKIMRTLTDVFTPGAPTIPEGLRTLAVSPERELEPGMTVRATFTFRNQGGATATGVRVKMN